MTSKFFHLHLHSQFSVQDGMSPVDNIAERIARYNQPGYGLTDHGLLSGTVKGYKAAKEFDLKFFPGIETYIIDPKLDASNLEALGDAQRYHLGLLGLDLKGYQGLVKLSTKAYSRPRFNRFPRLLVDDLVEWGEEYGKHIAITTGCVFGLLEKTLIDQGPDAASGILRMLQQVSPNLYVEVQKHNIPDDVNEMPEDQLIKETIALADKHGLPIITTADSHYLDQKQKSAHDLMKKIAYKSSDGSEFPGDTFHVASTGWMKEKWDADIWSRFEESYTDLLSKHDLVIPQLDTFQAHVPEVSITPDATLTDITYVALNNYGKGQDEEYINLLKHELDVIEYTQTANYFLLVKQCVDYAKSRFIPIEARGSAAGSLVCFLLGITQIDPLVWGTTFERFLSKDRVGQMPDVDIDIADVDRELILKYLDNLEINGVKYKTSQIGTFAELGQKKDDPNDTGSVFNSYIGYLRKMFMDNAWEDEKKKAEAENRKPVKAHADEAGAIAYNMSDAKNIKKIEDVKVFRPADYIGLKEIIEMKSVYNSKGTHPGGILISGQDVNIDEFIPLMMIPGQKKDTWVTQYTMKDVEQFGLLKMDWLGQTSLSVMKICQEFMGRDNPLDFSWIPNDDPKVIKYVQNMKNYGGLFHLEGYAKGIVAKELVLKSTQDFVLWQAASMPGAVDSGAKDEIVKRRKMKGGQKNYGYTNKILHDIFDETEGYCVYQEQILEVCRSVGMPGNELTSFFKIVKDSGAGSSERNKKRLDDARPRFYQLAQDAGLSSDEIEWVWKQMIAMGSYAFNKAHSASYGIRSYRTAYLKYHYPYEYMGALLYSWAGSNTQITYKRKKVLKEQMYLDMVNQMRLEVLPVRVNKSNENWKIETIGAKKFLRTGFVSVKGIGKTAADKIAKNSPYTDIVDFAERSGVTGGKPFLQELNKTGKMPEAYTGQMKTLNDIGAFASIDD